MTCTSVGAQHLLRKVIANNAAGHSRSHCCTLLKVFHTIMRKCSQRILPRLLLKLNFLFLSQLFASLFYTTKLPNEPSLRAQRNRRDSSSRVNFLWLTITLHLFMRNNPAVRESNSQFSLFFRTIDILVAHWLMFIFDMCRSSLILVTPVKYERDKKNVPSDLLK